MLSFKKSPCLFLQVTKKTSLTNIYIITGLIQSTSYNIRVTTLTTKGDSPKSKVLPVTTKKLDMTAADEWRDTLGINTIANDITNLKSRATNLAYHVRNMAKTIVSFNILFENDINSINFKGLTSHYA